MAIIEGGWQQKVVSGHNRRRLATEGDAHRPANCSSATDPILGPMEDSSLEFKL